MESQVPFKVYTFWEENSKPEVRRFGIDKGVVTSFQHLNAKLREVYPGLKTKNYTIAWRDEEGDDILISSNEEMVTAMTSLGNGLIRLFVNVKKPAKEDDCEFTFTATAHSSASNSDPSGPQAGDSKHGAWAKADDEPLHTGVTCSHCEWPVIGFRYKCVVCPDYDLCFKCEAAGNHRDHCMVRLPAPEMSRTLLKAAMKKSRRFFKTVSHGESHCKKQKGERCEKKSHEESHGRRAERQPRTHTSWLEIFSNYMNEFANLAGDFDFEFDSKTSEKKEQEQKKKPKKAKNETPEDVPIPEQSKDFPMKEVPKQEQPKPEQMQPEPSVSGQGQQQKAPEAADAQQPQAGASEMPKKKPNMPEIQKLLEMYVDEYYNCMTPGGTPVSTATNQPKSADSGGVVTGNTKEAEPTAPVAQSDTSSVASDKDVSPDKADDWTVINDEKDYAGAFGGDTASVNTKVHIGFDLPEEFKERVKIGEGSNLYPPLNTATAVLNPKEPEIQKVQPSQAQPSAPTKPEASTKPVASTVPVEPTKPVAQTQPTGQTQAQAQAHFQPQPSSFQPRPAQANRPQAQQMPQPTIRYHNKPHIDAAIRCMLSMGFTNEGGWLTQLLESKDGNIAAVIDMLNPVTPKHV